MKWEAHINANVADTRTARILSRVASVVESFAKGIERADRRCLSGAVTREREARGRAGVNFLSPLVPTASHFRFRGLPRAYPPRMRRVCSIRISSAMLVFKKAHELGKRCLRVARAAGQRRDQARDRGAPVSIERAQVNVPRRAAGGAIDP